MIPRADGWFSSLAHNIENDFRPPKPKPKPNNEHTHRADTKPNLKTKVEINNSDSDKWGRTKTASGTVKSSATAAGHANDAINEGKKTIDSIKDHKPKEVLNHSLHTLDSAGQVFGDFMSQGEGKVAEATERVGGKLGVARNAGKTVEDIKKGDNEAALKDGAATLGDFSKHAVDFASDHVLDRDSLSKVGKGFANIGDNFHDIGKGAIDSAKKVADAAKGKKIAKPLEHVASGMAKTGAKTVAKEGLGLFADVASAPKDIKNTVDAFHGHDNGKKAGSILSLVSDGTGIAAGVCACTGVGAPVGAVLGGVSAATGLIGGFLGG